MGVEVDVQQTFRSGGHDFNLCMQFSCYEDITVLFGQSGAGKSLLLKIIAGLQEVHAGKIVINERVLFDSSKNIDVPSRYRNVGYLFQDYALFPHMNVGENIGFSKRSILSKVLKGKDEERVHELLDIFQIKDFSKKYPSEISGGQRQRVGLARALLQRPDILLLDEPFSALDPLLRIQMREELKKIQSIFKIPILLITHDPQDVAELGERLVLIKQGLVSGSVDLANAPYRDSYGKPVRPEIRKILLSAAGVSSA
ncbi:ATP-binding cassette domain-containing protein [Burkholderiales bacterium]|nr:ATP-binding cassette domain-containing protein [Burkholderiales bacterium]